MNCLKCGTEIAMEQVFCESCLADMAKHPVKPDTPVILPTQNKPLPAKRVHRKLYKPEELLVSQRRMIGWLFALVILLLAAVGVLTAAMLHYKNAYDGLANKDAQTSIVSRETIFDNL